MVYPRFNSLIQQLSVILLFFLFSLHFHCFPLSFIRFSCIFIVFFPVVFKLPNKRTNVKSSHRRMLDGRLQKVERSATVADGQTSAAGQLRDERGWRAVSVRHEHEGTAYVGAQGRFLFSVCWLCLLGQRLTNTWQGTARSELHKATLLIAGAQRRQKTKRAAAARSDQQARNTEAEGFFGFPIFLRDAKKDREPTWGRSKERKFCDGLATLGATHRAEGSVLYLKKQTQKYKTVPDGLAQNLPTTDDEYRLTCSFRNRHGLY